MKFFYGFMGNYGWAIVLFDDSHPNTVYPASKQKPGVNEEDAGYTAHDERDKGKNTRTRKTRRRCRRR